jgi:hypothetical protein
VATPLDAVAPEVALRRLRANGGRLEIVESDPVVLAAWQQPQLHQLRRARVGHKRLTPA